MQTFDVLRRELANVRASRDALAAVIGPHLVPEAASALAKLNEAADDLLEVVRNQGG
jgi:hypothetical protein